MIEKIKNHLLNGLLLLLLFSSCKKEVSLEIQQDNHANFNELKSLVSIVKIWHDSTVSSNLSTKAQNGVRAYSVNENDIIPPIVDWEKAFINYDSSSVKSITVPILFNYKNGERIQLVATKSKGKLKGYFIKITPDSSYFAKQNEIYDYNNFSGSIAIYNLMGVRIKKQDFKTGIVTNLNNNNKVGLSYIKTFGDGFNTANDLLTVTVKSKKRKKYQFNGYNYGYIYIEEVQNIELDEGDGGGGVIAGGDESPDGYVDEITTKITDPCISSVMDDILSNDKQSEMMSYIKRQFGLNEKFNLNIKDVKNLKNPEGLAVAGHAKVHRDNDNGILTVNISINYGINSSKEFYAATILHEMIHGYIESQNIAQNEKEETIANSKYVDWMSAALISLFPNLSKSDANALALGGLYKTSYFNSLSQDIRDESVKINARHEIGNEGNTCK
jgi:hypothetical protein